MIRDKRPREPTEVTGPIEVYLWVATTAVDTDFTAKLIDVYPPSLWYPQGYAPNLTDSIARLRYRNGRERGELVKPGEPVQVTLTLYPTSNLFMPGHRIRLDVSSSNFPRFDVNPNTGEAIGRERRRVVADNTVFHERGPESRGGVAYPPSRALTCAQSSSVSVRQNIGTSTIGMFSISPKLSRSLSAVTM